MIVFVNSHRVEVADGSTAADAVGAFDPQLAETLAGGAAYLTDGTGQAVDPGTQLLPGAILRVARSARQQREE